MRHLALLHTVYPQGYHTIVVLVVTPTCTESEEVLSCTHRCSHAGNAGTTQAKEMGIVQNFETKHDSCCCASLVTRLVICSDKCWQCRGQACGCTSAVQYRAAASASRRSGQSAAGMTSHLRSGVGRSLATQLFTRSFEGGAGTVSAVDDLAVTLAVLIPSQISHAAAVTQQPWLNELSCEGPSAGTILVQPRGVATPPFALEYSQV